MHLFAVVALQRLDLNESVIALRGKEQDARRSAREYAVAMAGTFVRCRVQPMNLSVEQVKAICFRWGKEDADSGESVTNELPGVYGEAYRRGYESARRTSGPPPP